MVHMKWNKCTEAAHRYNRVTLYNISLLERVMVKIVVIEKVF